MSTDDETEEGQDDDVMNEKDEELTPEKEFLKRDLDKLVEELKNIKNDDNPVSPVSEDSSITDEDLGNLEARLGTPERPKQNVEVRELQRLTATDQLDMIKKFQPEIIETGRFTRLDYFVLIPEFISLGKNSI